MKLNIHKKRRVYHSVPFSSDTISNLKENAFRILKTNSTKRIKNGLLLNFGAEQLQAEVAKDVVVLNHPEFIEQSSDKVIMFNMLSEFMPYTTTNINELPDLPFYAKGRTGRKGRNKVLVTEENRDTVDLARYSLFQTYIEAKREFRTFVIKTPDGDPKVLISHVREAPGVFVQCGKRISGTGIDLIHFSRNVAEQTDLDFIALDILRANNEELFLLEINSCPGIGASTAVRLDSFLQRWWENG